MCCNDCSEISSLATKLRKSSPIKKLLTQMRSINLLHVVWVVAHGCLAATGELFQRPQFGDGMILQRGNGTLIFGYKAVAPVKVVVKTASVSEIQG